jgi:hypothetical protein
MENRLKEQLMLFADRTGTAFLRSNQIRLYFSWMAYLLLEALRQLGLQGSEFAQAQATAIRLKVLKLGALIRVTVRKVWIALAGGYPYAEQWARIWRQLQVMSVAGVFGWSPAEFLFRFLAAKLVTGRDFALNRKTRRRHTNLTRALRL